jgi:hypothetical protein
MLLEVALDLDAEAEAMENGGVTDRRGSPRVRRPVVDAAMLHVIGPVAEPPVTEPRPVQIIDLSAGGAKFRADRTPTPGSRVVLELPACALRLDGTIVRTRGSDVAMAFDPASRADPALNRLLRCATLTDHVRA